MKLKALTTTNKLKINNETKIHTHTHTHKSLPFGKLTLSIHFHFHLLKLENSHNFKSFTAEPMVYIFSRAQKNAQNFSYMLIHRKKKQK